MGDLTRIQSDNIKDDTIKPQNLAISNPGSFGPNDVVTLSADGEKFEIIPSPGFVGVQLDLLADVDIDAPALDGQILQFDGGVNQWKNVMPGGPSIPIMSLNDLLDVTEAASVDGDVLVFDFGTTQYVNRKLFYSELDNIPLTFAPQTHSHSISHINDWPFSGPPVIGDMNDVNLTGISVGNILEWNGIAFVPASKAIGVSVDSFLGRTGDIVAVSGDYGTDFITNESTVAGMFLTDALNTLKVAITNTPSDFTDLDDTPGTLAGNGSKVVAVNALGTALEFVVPIAAIIDSVFGRTGFVLAAASDYNASQVDNDSSVAGVFVSNALDTLNTAVLGIPGAFTDLTDTPGSISIPDANKLVAVNGDGTSLEFVTPTPAPVDSVYGRTGVVTAVVGDYDASQVDNDSSVAGAFVSDALDTLNSTKADEGIVPTSIGDLTDVNLNGISDTFILKWDIISAKFVVVAAPIAGAVAFTGLTDVPASYVGQAGKQVVVTGSENGLEFVDTGVVTSVFGRIGVVVAETSDYDASQIDNDSTVTGAFVSDALSVLNSEKASDFIDLGDTPVTLSSSGGKTLAVNVDGTAIEFVDAVIGGAVSFTGLSDTPSSYVGQGNKLISINSIASGLEFITIPVISVHGRTGVIISVNSDYDASQIDNDSGVSGAFVSNALDVLNTAVGTKAAIFTDLNDTPSTMLVGDAGKYVTVNVGGTALEYITLPAIPSALDDLINVTVPTPTTGDHLEWSGAAWINAASPIGGATTFIELTDTAGAMGTNGQLVAVNAGGDALEFIAPPVVPSALDDLINVTVPTPTTGDHLEWSGAAWINAASPIGGATTFIELTDTAGAMGTNGQLVAVNAGGDALEFIAPPVVPSALDDLANVTVPTPTTGDHLEWSGTAWINAASPIGGATTFIELTDTAGAMGTNGQLVAVNAGGDALEFIAPPVVPSALDDLANVTVPTPTTGDHLEWSGAAWINAVPSIALNDLTDVILVDADPGDLLRYNGAQWTDIPETNFATGAEGDLAATALQSVQGDAAPVLGGSLVVDGNSIVSTSSGDIAITPNTTGNIVLDGLKWPQVDGDPTFVLTTDGFGQLSWAAPGTPATFIALTDTPGIMGTNGQLIAVNVGGDALEFITPPVIPTAISDLTDDSGHISNITNENIGDLLDVNIAATPNDGDILEWDTSTSKFIVVPAPSGATFTSLSDTPVSFSGQGGKVVAVNTGQTALEFVSPAAGSGFQTEWIKIPYTAGGFIDTGIGITSSAGVSVAVTLNAVNTNIRISITFNGVNGQDKPPASIMSYGYVRGNNNYIVQPLNLTFGGGNAVLDPGGVAGAPGDILNSFIGMSIDEIQMSTSAVGASTDDPGQPPHAILILGW